MPFLGDKIGVLLLDDGDDLPVLGERLPLFGDEIDVLLLGDVDFSDPKPMNSPGSIS